MFWFLTFGNSFVVLALQPQTTWELHKRAWNELKLRAHALRQQFRNRVTVVIIDDVDTLYRVEGKEFVTQLLDRAKSAAAEDGITFVFVSTSEVAERVMFRTCVCGCVIEELKSMLGRLSVRWTHVHVFCIVTVAHGTGRGMIPIHIGDLTDEQTDAYLELGGLPSHLWGTVKQIAGGRVGLLRNVLTAAEPVKECNETVLRGMR